MKLSVIAWDADFRESYHTIDYFIRQNYPVNDFEFIWVDYYKSNERVEKKISGLSNFKLLTLNNSTEQLWNLGTMFNAAVKLARFENLILIDGDIVVNSMFLQQVSENYTHPEIVTYIRRYDEPKIEYKNILQPDLERLTRVAKLVATINYAGCAVIHRNQFMSVNGFEESEYFNGPGMIAKEFYTRLKNSGIPIRWAPDLKVYHPYHEGTLTAYNTTIFDNLKQLSMSHMWINPYAGLFQSWILRQREVNVDTKADYQQCEIYVKAIPKKISQAIYR